VLLARRFMMHAQLLAKSRIDTKTGLLNVATWETEATAEIARAVRTRSPLCLALIDIDHFKAVNDTYGHLVGDKALRAVSDALREQLRSYDLAGRFGGEEFAILLPHTELVTAEQITERLRVKLAEISITPGTGSSTETPLQVTVSIGVAALAHSRRDLDELIAAADAALYRAKAQGRNQVCLMAEDMA
jgi:diguanylate cyclase (GGDEF)-like protein